MESRTTARGRGLGVCHDAPCGALGLSVCYDLRFPELYQRLAFGLGAGVLAVPSAFTKPTGEGGAGVGGCVTEGKGREGDRLLALTSFRALPRFPTPPLSPPTQPITNAGQAHWEVLLRARAIETQCYVIAAAQAGRHNDKRESYGHALIIDPWGTVVARLADPEATGVAVADIDAGLLARVRAKMPMREHRLAGRARWAAGDGGQEGGE